jgi:nitroimidazol reductase NimA-like FMN-containing flavoprotein (pyridoxamine 5'-phosphate oxidase superfamily)
MLDESAPSDRRAGSRAGEEVTMADIIELTVDECLSLLETKRIGRIGLTTEVGTQIFPVNYVLSEELRIVFRTLPYGVIANHAHGADVAFEVDDLDQDAEGGWSVLAVGRCTRIEDPSEVRMVRQREDPSPWVEGQRILYFTIDWKNLTGRQVGDRSTLLTNGPTA